MQEALYYPEFPCRTCGEPTASTAGGLCHNCQRQEMIDDDVPNYPLDPYLYDGICPVCRGHVHTKGGNYHNDYMQEICDDCGWTSEPEYD